MRHQMNDGLHTLHKHNPKQWNKWSYIWETPVGGVHADDTMLYVIHSQKRTSCLVVIKPILRCVRIACPVCCEQAWCKLFDKTSSTSLMQVVPTTCSLTKFDFCMKSSVDAIWWSLQAQWRFWLSTFSENSQHYSGPHAALLKSGYSSFWSVMLVKYIVSDWLIPCN